MQFPYAEIQLQTNGNVADPAAVQQAIATVTSAQASDVVLLVHGWNDDMPAARTLYQQLTDSMVVVRPQVPQSVGRAIAVIGILWPSITWADTGLIAGGGAALDDPQAALASDIRGRIPDPAVADKLAALVPELDSSAAARESYLDLLRTQLPPAPAKDEDQPPPTFTDGAADTVFELAGASGDLSGTGLGGGAADLGGLDDAGGVGVTGGAAAFSLGGFLAGARNLLNLTTFYTMKNRAGLVGTNGVSAVLSALAESAPQARLHLTGHSFGARAVSAAAATTTAPLHSMSLLQGAFSHFGFATNWDGKNDNGVFVAAPGRLLGPLMVTHTVNDKAILLAYALASRLAQETAAGLGDASDPYGGLGASGALMTANTDDALLLDVGGAYAFAAGRVANLNADAFISGHSDVTGHQVGYAVLTAMCV